jgi:arylsulfatase A-like enzyme
MTRTTASQPLTRRGALAALAVPALLRSQAAQRPNIVFLITDDQRYDAMSCAGNRILHTPNMDRIAAGGIHFRNAFVINSLCGPSRASYLTGLYTHTHGVRVNEGNPPGLRPGQITWPLLLQRAGYQTAAVGKWHINSDPEGFDSWRILPGQGRYANPIFRDARGRTEFTGWACDVVGHLALDFLKQRATDRPFALWCGFKEPHRAWEPAPRLAHVYDDVRIPEPATFHDDLRGRPAAVRDADNKVWNMPDFAKRGVAPDLPPDQRKRENFQAMVKNWYRCVAGVDQNVGRILDFLDENGLSENTIVVFTSDNGFFLGEHGMFDKRLMYEESLRVPLLLRYPRLVKPGTVATGMALNVDVAPTMLELAGVAPPELHGRSLVPLLAGSAPASWRKSFLYEYYEYPGSHSVRKNRGVRTGRWKYIHYFEPPEEFELYDLQKDPREVNNLYGRPQYAGKVAELRAELDRLRKETADPD